MLIHTHCLSCVHEIPINGPPEVGERLACPGCETTFEVVWLFPLELDYPVEETSRSETPADFQRVRIRYGGKKP